MSKKNKLTFWLFHGLIFITFLSSITIILLASYVLIQTWLRILLVVIAIVIMFSGTILATIMDYKLGCYECKFCKHRFNPTLKAYIMGPHTFTSRKLKCPNCGKKSYCKKIYD